MKNNNSSIKTVVAVGIGAALFFVLGRFVAIPSPVPPTPTSVCSTPFWPCWLPCTAPWRAA